ncbi:MAG: GyrI-like domain-containing protein, partial [Promethearchaeota archaeon]
MSYKCEVKEKATQPTLTIRKKTSVQNISQVLGKAFGEIIMHIMGSGQQPSGPPFVAYYNMDMQNLDIEIGFPVSKKLSSKGDIKANEIPGGKFAICLHKGPYDKIAPAY